MVTQTKAKTKITDAQIARLIKYSGEHGQALDSLIQGGKSNWRISALAVVGHAAPATHSQAVELAKRAWQLVTGVEYTQNFGVPQVHFGKAGGGLKTHKPHYSPSSYKRYSCVWRCETHILDFDKCTNLCLCYVSPVDGPKNQSLLDHVKGLSQATTTRTSKGKGKRNKAKGANTPKATQNVPTPSTTPNGAPKLESVHDAATIAARQGTN